MDDLQQPCSLAVIGVSTGGPKTLKELFFGLPKINGTIVVVQHMPQFINESLRRTLSQVTVNTVKLAADGDELCAGSIFLAPSDVHLTFEMNRYLRLAAGPKVNFCCPSIDVAMSSLAPSSFGVMGIILTGMGNDGAAGIVHIKKTGEITIAQDEATSILYGMPKAAFDTGKVDSVLALSEIRTQLISFMNGK